MGGYGKREKLEAEWGGGRQTDPDEDIYRTLMKVISKMGEVVGKGSIKEQKHRRFALMVQECLTRPPKLKRSYFNLVFTTLQQKVHALL